MWRRFLADTGGTMAILFAAGFALSAAVAALAVDAGSLYYEQRRMQAGVDLAAISAVADPARAGDIARSVLVEAHLLAAGSAEGLRVETGHYDATRALGSRFRAGEAPVNAVRVSFRKVGNLYFAQHVRAPTIAVSGIAAVTPEVSFSIGSRLASVNGGVTNSVLSSLLGLNVSLTALDYRALADARIDLYKFLDALAPQLGVTAGRYDDLLALRAGTGTIARTLAGLSTGLARTRLLTLAGATAGQSVSIGKLVALGPYGQHAIGATGTAGLGVSFSALDLLTGAAALADGRSQINLPLTANVPGLTRLEASLRVGEPAQGGSWFAIGAEGTVLRTAQLRLRIRAELAGGLLLGSGGVSLPLWLDLAHSEATILAATCPGPGQPRGRASVAVRPGVIRLGLGDLTDANLAAFGSIPAASPVRILDVPLVLRVTASGRIEVSQTQPLQLDFSSADIAAGTVRTARVQTIPSSLFGSLFGALTITPQILGVRLGLGTNSTIVQAVRDLITPLGPTLDLTLSGTLAALGLGIGETDIRVHAVRCDNPVLVG